MQSFETSRLSQNCPSLSEPVLDPMVRDLPLVIWGVSTDEVTGRNKLVINHLGKLFVTSDAATIIREIEVVHPAAKLLVMASQAQESEVSRIRLSTALAQTFGLDGRRYQYGNDFCWRAAQKGREFARHGSSP